MCRIVKMASLATVDPEPLEVLQPCPRGEAPKATAIRRALREYMGRWQAGALLSLYREAVLLMPSGCYQRCFVDSAGVTQRVTPEIWSASKEGHATATAEQDEE
jgi:hypothetical protein